MPSALTWVTLAPSTLRDPVPDDHVVERLLSSKLNGGSGSGRDSVSRVAVPPRGGGLEVSAQPGVATCYPIQMAG